MSKHKLPLKKRRKPRLTPGAEDYFISGIDTGEFDFEGGGGAEAAHAEWKLHRSVIMKQWHADPVNLGRRPFAWWQWDRPKDALRRCISGWPPLPDAPIFMGYAAKFVDNRTLIEPEVFFLERHGLLTSVELRNVDALKAKAREELVAHAANRNCAPPQEWAWEGTQDASPTVSPETVATLKAQLMTCSPTEFAAILFELEG